MTDTHQEPTPTKPFALKPDGRVNTTWKVLGSIILATGVVVGGLISIKHDLSQASRDAKEALSVVQAMREDLLRLKVALGVYDPHASRPASAPRSTP